MGGRKNEVMEWGSNTWIERGKVGGEELKVFKKGSSNIHKKLGGGVEVRRH